MKPRYAIIVAGGNGLRMGNEIPKQFLLLNNKPILMHAITQFQAFDSAISCIVVLPVLQIAYWETLCETYQFSLPHTVVSGGKERFHSVANGLNAINGSGLVAVHDGVRPIITKEMLEQGFQTSEIFDSAVPYIDSVDSLRQIDGEDSKTLDRTRIKRIQTPQIFDVEKLKKAMDTPYKPEFTDEATVWENAGHKVHFYKGNSNNIKITTPIDLEIAEIIIKKYTDYDK